MAWGDREIIGQLRSMVDLSCELSSLLTLMLASSPPREISPSQMDAFTELAYEILTISGENEGSLVVPTTCASAAAWARQGKARQATSWKNARRTAQH